MSRGSHQPFLAGMPQFRLPFPRPRMSSIETHEWIAPMEDNRLPTESGKDATAVAQNASVQDSFPRYVMHDPWAKGQYNRGVNGPDVSDCNIDEDEREIASLDFAPSEADQW